MTAREQADAIEYAARWGAMIFADDPYYKDIRQECRIWAWKLVPKWREGRGANLQTFLANCVRRKAISFWCRKSREVKRSETYPYPAAYEQPLSLEALDAELPSHSHVPGVDRLAVHIAFDSLPSPSQAVIRDYVLRGETQASIGRRWGVSQNYVSLLYRKARVQLAHRLIAQGVTP